jgi:CrcB protein
VSGADVAAVAGAGALGCLLRYWLALLLPGGTLPWPTLVCNLLGSLAIGLAYALLERHGLLAGRWRLVVLTGLLGGFTTYSSFALETVGLLERRALASALGYVALTSAGALACCALGLWLVRRA